MGREPRTRGWIILRTAGRSTLCLAASLAEDGFEVWTPQREQMIRKPRWNVARKATLPLLAGFVFARAEHLVDMLELSAMPDRPRRGRRPAHREFSVLRDYDRIPIVDDAALEPLRMAEKPAAVRRRFSRYAPGSEVRITAGSFEGFTATVEQSGKDFAVVWVSLFGRHHRAKINAFKLQPISVEGAEAVRKAA